MDDETAYMELVRSNTQSELTALERGMHALHSGLDPKPYSANAGRDYELTKKEIQAARVAEAVSCQGNVSPDLTRYFIHLTSIHPAPRWLWAALVEKLVADDLSVIETRQLVAK